MNSIPLNDTNLSQISDEVKKPSYDRALLTPGIVHIGVGNFHRAHQAWYLHRLFEQGVNLNWAIIGAGVRPYDAEMRLKMKTQDYLTTLIELDPSGKSAEIVGSMINYLPIEEGNGPLIDQMTDPAIRIVALTVTEGGYYIEPATKGFDEHHPDILHDAKNPEKPKTAFGAIIAALKRRQRDGTGPFTCLCCDNLQGNGTILRQAIVSLARLSDPELAEWIDTNCSFPSSMVDCIVPATGPAELELTKEFFIEDLVPVTHENFRQWVIEDDFCAGRPDWEKAGATFSDQVHEFEMMKIRILNGGHQVIADAAEILGIQTIAEAMHHPKVGALFRKIATREIIPHVKPVPGYTPEEYVQLIDTRFSNPKIVDTTRRVAFDGSSRHPGFIIPTIKDGLRANSSVSGLALVSAAWARYCLGVREDGSPVEPNDPFWSDLQECSQAARENPHKWLEMHHIYGELGEHSEFSNTFTFWLNLIYTSGMESAIDTYLDMEQL